MERKNHIMLISKTKHKKQDEIKKKIFIHFTGEPQEEEEEEEEGPAHPLLPTYGLTKQ